MLEAMEKIHLENQQLKERIELLNSQLVSEYKKNDELQARIDKVIEMLKFELDFIHKENYSNHVWTIDGLIIKKILEILKGENNENTN